MFIKKTTENKNYASVHKREKNEFRKYPKNKKNDNDYLENSQSEKFFWVTIDESLCWTERVDKTCKKIIFNLHILKEIKEEPPS